MIVLVAAWTAAFFFALFFMCGTDFEAIWGPTVNLYTICTKTLATILSLCFTDFFADIMIITIPIPLVRYAISPKHAYLEAYELIDMALKLV